MTLRTAATAAEPLVALETDALARTSMNSLDESAATVIGPLLLGMDKSVQIAPLSASVSRVLQMATLAAYEQDLAEAQAS